MNARYFFLLLLMSVFAASCSNDLELSDQEGYVRLELNTLTSTNTRAVNNPSDYNPKKLKVQILDSNNAVVMQTEDVDNDAAFKGNIALTAGQYTIKASSAGWDGSGSGMDTPYYVGSTVVNISRQGQCDPDTGQCQGDGNFRPWAQRIFQRDGLQRVFEA